MFTLVVNVGDGRDTFSVQRWEEEFNPWADSEISYY